MKNKLPMILLGAACIALGIGFYNSYTADRNSRQEFSRLSEAYSALEAENERLKAARAEDVSQKKADVAAASLTEEQPREVEETQKSDAGRRMMSGMARMMGNPTMSKVVEASQRGAIGALYSDLMEDLDLNDEETEYFMEILMFRQMKHVDLGMKMMSGDLSEEEKTALTEDIKSAGEAVKEEVELFLNDSDDYAEWKFYEKTMGERMMLSQMDQNLAASGVALSDETHRELLEAMHQEKKDFQFSSDLHDETNTDLNAARFSKENLQNNANDTERLNGLISQRARDMLTPDQYTAFSEGLKTTTEMRQAQLEMAAQMFGGKEE